MIKTKMEQLAKRVTQLKAFKQYNRLITDSLSFYIDTDDFNSKDVEDCYFHFTMEDIELTHHSTNGGSVKTYKDIDLLEDFDIKAFLDGVEREIEKVEETNSVPQEIVIDGVKFVRA